MPAPIPSIPRIRCFLLIICIFIGFMLLGLTRRAFATCADGVNAYYTSVGAGNACSAAKGERSGCYYNASGALYWAYMPNPARDYIYFYICSGCPNNKCCAERDALELQCGGPDKYVSTCQGSCNSTGGDTCSDQRAEAESSCGGPDAYIIDDATCLWLCKNPDECTGKAKQECVDEENIDWIYKSLAKCLYKCKSKCTDRDKDGVEDVCDYCPNDPEVSDQIKVIYRYNNGVQQCAAGYMTCDGRLIRNFPPGTVF